MTVEWAMSELVRKLAINNRATEALDSVAGKERGEGVVHAAEREMAGRRE